MKKEIIIISILIAAITVLTIFCFATKEKTAYIDVNVLMEKYEGMKKAKKEFEQKSKAWQANVDTLLSGLQNDIAEYEKNRTSMSKKEQILKEELLRNKQQQLFQYQEATKRKSQEEEQKMTQTVLNEMNDYIKEYGEEHVYKYVFGANGTGNLLYANEYYDITDEVIEGLNKEYNGNK